MADKLLIGLDFGSDSVRALLLDETGRELGTAVRAYPRWSEGKYSIPAMSQFRQHPLDYLECTTEVIRDVLQYGDRSKVAGIGVDTTGSTPCAVNADGVPLALLDEFAEDPDAMFILWKDHTALEESQRINDVAKTWGGTDYTMYSGGTNSPEWFFSKLLYVLRHNEKVRNAAASFVEHCDWITAELAGTKVKRSHCAAGHKAMWHESWGGLPSQEFLSAVDPLLNGWRSRLYNETATADEPVGTLSEKWAAALGLSTGVVISGGAFDCHMGAVGAGIKEGQMVKVVGTSTCDIMVAKNVEKCIRGICGQVRGSVVPGMIGMEAGQAAFGDIYAWFKRFLSYGGEISLPKLEQEAAALPDSDKILALDWMNGRRSPDANPLLTGALFGINLGTTPPMIFKALVESTAFGSRRIAERFREEGVKIDSIAAIGGIAKKSSFVMQTCADVLNMPIRVVRSEQTCALGAAMFAAVAAKIYPDTISAMEAMNSGYDAEYLPDPAKVAHYNAMYQRYLALANAVETETMGHYF